MRCHAAPWSPRFGDLGERLGVRAFAQTKSEARGFLHGKVARRNRILMSEAKQKINVCGPRPDAVQGGKCGVCYVGIHVADGG